ncbi:F-box/FBD/LRR-repeat protein At5g56420 isoform X2 [Triticum aestivum]|uniref:F-box/FBD/LRR-repeat protein At5g56420 isoform X2 n=1 Tax=Triticum aestivum TaxID=4565 RepID=UPI001D03331F|nr:F-box/FBD/LRR-repeat protein At5g56420-like isoform X2 [Triticum aestivum]
MELRSGRRVRRSPPPRRARSRRGPSGGADDRLSTLPDDMLLLVLARLRCARSAARTGILSRRWRGLWTCLPDLTFRDVAPIKIEAVLARLASSPTVPATLDIDIHPTHCADGARLACLLDAVVMFSPRELRISYQFDSDMEAVDLHPPCFPRATSLEIHWGANICFTPLPSGEFSALERLSLGGASVIGIDTLITRCPCLRMLTVIMPTSGIKVHSVSLQTLDVFSDEEVCISSIDIVTPKLKQLELIFDTDTDLSVSISAPMVEEVMWSRGFTETTLLFGFWLLGHMALMPAYRFGDGYYWREEDTRSVHVLYLVISSTDQLEFDLDMAHEVEFAQEMKKLPVINFSVLKLLIETHGHVFGALVQRLLGLDQICAVMKRLLVTASSILTSMPGRLSL